MGEGGIDPEYFLNRMEWWEVNRYLAGIRRRQRAQWETTRWQIASIANLFRGKDSPTVKPSDLVTFPWEKDQPNPDAPTDEDVAELQAEMDAINGIAQ